MARKSLMAAVIRAWSLPGSSAASAARVLLLPRPASSNALAYQPKRQHLQNERLTAKKQAGIE